MINKISDRDLYKDLVCTFDGPKSPEMIFDFDRISEDGNIEAAYVPLLPGEYKITITYKKRVVKGSPFTAKITGKKMSADKLISKVRHF